MGTNGKPSATAIIGKSEALDLNALLSSNPTIETNGHSTSAPSHALDTQMMNMLRQAGTRLSQKSLLEVIRATLQKNARIPANKNSSSAIPSTSSIIHQTRKPRSSLSWNERLCFSGDYIFFNDGKTVKRDYTEQAIQYKCTFPGCQKRLASNINFMHHVVAHAKNARSRLIANSNNMAVSLNFGIPSEMIGEREQQLRAETCFECLSEFTTMRQLYNHIFYVHRSRGRPSASRPVCFICEKIVPLADAEKHAEMHGEQPLPFHCPACRWRTSNRQALLCHFEQFHDANSLIFCPFCFLKFPIKRPSSVKGTTRGVLTVPHFVEHCLDHFRDKSKKHGCDKCSVKLCAQRADDLKARIDEHRSSHERTIKLKIERRKLTHLLNANLNQRFATANCLPSICYDCGHLVNSFNSHYRKMGACKNQNCQFETRCIKAQQQHELVCPFLKNADARIPFGWKSLANIKINSFNKEQLLLVCNMCSYETRDAYLFNEHLRKCIGTKPKFASSLSPFQKRQQIKDAESEDNSISNHPNKISLRADKSKNLEPLDSSTFTVNDSADVQRRKSLEIMDELINHPESKILKFDDSIYSLTARLGNELEEKNTANLIAKRLFPFGRLSHRRN